MGFFSNDFSEQRDQFSSTEHHGHITHDVLGGAAAYEALKAYEDHCAANGQPDSHAKAKEILAGFVGAGLTRLAETKGLDAWDAHKRAAAEQEATRRIDEVVTVNTYNNY